MAKFVETADFSGPTKPDNLTSGKTNVHIFANYYNRIGQDNYAYIVYHNYRSADLKKEFSFLAHL